MPRHSASKQRRAGLLDLPTELHKVIINARRADFRPAMFDYPAMIWEWVPDISSLSLVAKGLTDVCQEELFSDIHMHGKDVTGLENYEGPESPSMDTMTAFCDLMKTRPDIGAYARTLVFVIPEASVLWNKNTTASIVTALSLMPAITKLQVLDEKRRHQFNFQTAYQDGEKRLAGALLSIITNKRLQHLSLYNVELPSWTLAKCKELSTLELHGTRCFYWDSEEYPKKPVKGSPIYLEHFVISGDISKGLFKTEQRRQHSNINLAKVSKFEAPMNPERLARFLREMASLRVLRLTLHDFDLEDVATKGVLSYLDSRSFATLRELKLSIGFAVPYYGASRADNIIRDPYQGLTRDGTLAQLTELRLLEILVDIAGEGGTIPNLNPEGSFGEEWGTLEKVLLPVGCKPPLQYLELIRLTVVFQGDMKDTLGWLVREFGSRVRLRQFPLLMESEKPCFSLQTLRT